jgi:O-methyltransferase
MAYTGLVAMLAFPAVAADYFDRDTGREYGVGFLAKLGLLIRFSRNVVRIRTASTVFEHMNLATQLLRVPADLDGRVVECGTYKGGSAANLSLVCRLTGRELHIYDSFTGLPAPKEGDRAHVLPSLGEVHTYEEGAFAGSVEEVEENLERYGARDVCRLHPGDFAGTMQGDAARSVLVFADVDHRDSLETCVRWLWPSLQDGCRFFAHEAPHMEIASLFFDREWWAENVQGEPPGLVGAGTGIGLHLGRGGFGSSLGFALKGPAREAELKLMPQR